MKSNRLPLYLVSQPGLLMYLEMVAGVHELVRQGMGYHPPPLVRLQVFGDGDEAADAHFLLDPHRHIDYLIPQDVSHPLGIHLTAEPQLAP